MPTYSYRCPKCGHEYDKFQKMSDSVRPKCPECGTKGERVISGGAGFVFKGSGFYTTDYKRAGEKKDAAREQADKKAGAASKQADKPSKTDKSKKADKTDKSTGADS